jgi:exodeoxyribonuclease V beta subunit
LPALPGILADLGHEAGVLKHIKNKPARDWFRPQDMAAVTGLAELQVQGRLAALAGARDSVRARAAALKRDRRLYSFDDMIQGLYRAITDPDGGEVLADALRRTWPWALVDEFQDTDPVQYAILQRVYGSTTAQASAAGGLVLIGDPKQAIYGFRGGDVFAYLEAAADAECQYGMAANFRSTPAVLNGLAALFTHGGERAFVLDGIAFRPVQAGRSDADRGLELDGNAVAGVTAWAVPEDAEPAKTKIQPRIEAATVDRIAALLDPARTTAARDHEHQHPLQPGEIAVLVNSNVEAAAMQAALTRAGVPAVCIHQASVFAQPPARELLQVLRAAATPYDLDRLRVALTTELFGYRLGDLVALDGDDGRWREATRPFRDAHTRWGRAGVQATLEPLLQQAAGRILARPDGERRMTDYLHTVERLQEAEHEVFGMAGVIRWLEEAIQRAADGEVGDGDRLRLEADTDLVQVTTVHKTKGLQFAVVFVPYAPWLGTGGGDPTQPPWAYHDDDHHAVLDPGSLDGDHACPRALRERRAEQIRLLYVALTRAEQACFFVWGALNQAANGPLAWLLHQDDGASVDNWHRGNNPPPWLDAATVRQRLEAVAGAAGGGFAIETLPDPPPRPMVGARAAASEPGPARTDLPGPRLPWGVFSFSGLAGRVEAAAAPATDSPAGADDTDAGAEPATQAPEVPLHPRGPAFGQAFHDLVEAHHGGAWPAPGEPLAEDQATTIAQALRRHGVGDTDRDGTAGPVERTDTLIRATVHTPLPDIGALAALPPPRTATELEFFLRLRGARGRSLLAAVAAAGYGTRSGVDATVLNGLMHGYIDLVVEQGGRYWIIDYKTNVVGPRSADYAPDALAEAVRAHHYDLQYLIYSVALHRHLRARLPGYDPARHLGGVQYLFVRGLDPDAPARGVHRDQPPVALIEQLDALLDTVEVTA